MEFLLFLLLLLFLDRFSVAGKDFLEGFFRFLRFFGLLLVFGLGLLLGLGRLGFFGLGFFFFGLFRLRLLLVLLVFLLRLFFFRLLFFRLLFFIFVLLILFFIFRFGRGGLRSAGVVVLADDVAFSLFSLLFLSALALFLLAAATLLFFTAAALFLLTAKALFFFLTSSALLFLALPVGLGVGEVDVEAASEDAVASVDHDVEDGLSDVANVLSTHLSEGLGAVWPPDNGLRVVSLGPEG